MNTERFEQQIKLQGFGPEAQQKLMQSSVLIIGAGGLGCPALLYLAAAGIGRIGIVDHDHISISNLNRQIIYSEAEIGKQKAVIAGEYFRNKYTAIQVDVHNEKLTQVNVIDLFNKYDVVLDCTDNVETRYLINDACVLLKKTFVFGSIYKNEGQVAVFNVFENEVASCNYRDVYPYSTAISNQIDCTTIGVIGVLPGIIGTMQAAEVIKVITGFQKALVNKLLLYNLNEHQTYTIQLSANENSRKEAPQTIAELLQFNYFNQSQNQAEITWEVALNLSIEATSFIDVRESNESTNNPDFEFYKLPLSQLKNKNLNANNMPAQTNYVIFCASGIRSVEAEKILKTMFPNKHIFSVKGGMQTYSGAQKPIHYGS